MVRPDILRKKEEVDMGVQKGEGIDTVHLGEGQVAVHIPYLEVVGILSPVVVGIPFPEVAGILGDIQYAEVAGEVLGDLAREPAFLLLLTCLIND
jgi:hypothetical protein